PHPDSLGGRLHAPGRRRVTSFVRSQWSMVRNPSWFAAPCATRESLDEGRLTRTNPMRSIRLSLIVYFLVLLGAALGAVSWSAYHSTQKALEAKEDSTTKLLKTRYEAPRHH